MSLFGGTSSAPLQQGFKQSNKLLKKGQKKSIAQYAEGLSQASPLYEKAAAQFTPYQQSGQALNGLYSDALGGNGQTGYDNAQNAFHTAPGYNFLQEQGEQGILRNQAALGGLNSGNSAVDLLKFNNGLADQSYQQWLDNLFRGSGQGLQAAQGAASANMAQGGMTADNYNNRAATIANAFGARANNASQFGANMTNLNAANQANNTALLGAGLSGLTALAGLSVPGGGSIGGSLYKSIIG